MMKFVGCAMLAIGVTAVAIEAQADYVYVPAPQAPNYAATSGNCPDGQVVTFMACRSEACSETWIYCETPKNAYGETLSLTGASSSTAWTDQYQYLPHPYQAVCPSGWVMTGFKSINAKSFNIAAICRQIVIPAGYRYYANGYDTSDTVASGPGTEVGYETYYQGPTLMHAGVRCQDTNCAIINPYPVSVGPIIY